MIKRFLLAIGMYASLYAAAQEVTIIPRPQKVKQAAGSFTINASTVIVTQGSDLETSVSFLNNYLEQYYGFHLQTSSTNTSKSNAIVLNNRNKNNTITGAYKLDITKNGVGISGDNKEGVFYGIQSLLQLLPTSKQSSLAVPQLSIEDAPRFSYRGMHLDVSRHFMPVDFVKRYIDYIAMFKMNTFHWHLTDDQGWRIEIKKYPKLTETGAWRDGTIIGHYPGTGNDNKQAGGFYTQEQIKEVVKYAAARMITVIPEIEMPGHASAAIAAYPFLSCFPEENTVIPEGNISQGGKQKQANGVKKIVQESWGVFPDVFAPTEETFTFLQNVLDEVIELFPSNYIHVGGDECPKDSWKRSTFCQQMIKEKGLKDEHGLQSYFIQRIEKYLNGKGRQIIGWDEILEGGLAPNATVMSWRGEQGGIDAAKQHHKVVMTPTTYVYFDYSETKNDDSLSIGGYLPLDTVYGYNPVPPSLNAEEARYVLGGQANLWTEYTPTPRKVEYKLFPRFAALSEVLWTNKENKDKADFYKRLPALKERLTLIKTNYNPKTLP